LNLPSPGPSYSVENEAQTRAALEREDKRNQKLGEPIILVSPNGSRFSLAVDNAGALSTVALP
jgi:hypothetical protein